MNIQPANRTAQNLNRILDVDKTRDTEVSLYESKGLPFFKKDVEITLSDAAQRISQGKQVIIEERPGADVSYSQTIADHGDKSHVDSGTHHVQVIARTHIEDAADLEAFTRFSTNEAPQTPTEKMARVLAPYVNPHNEAPIAQPYDNRMHVTGSQDSISSSPGTGTFAPAEEFLSAYEGAKQMRAGKDIAVERTPTSATLENSYGDSTDELSEWRFPVIQHSQNDVGGPEFIPIPSFDDRKPWKPSWW